MKNVICAVVLSCGLVFSSFVVIQASSRTDLMLIMSKYRTNTIRAKTNTAISAAANDTIVQLEYFQIKQNERIIQLLEEIARNKPE